VFTHRNGETNYIAPKNSDEIVEKLKGSASFRRLEGVLG